MELWILNESITPTITVGFVEKAGVCVGLRAVLAAKALPGSSYSRSSTSAHENPLIFVVGRG